MNALQRAAARRRRDARRSLSADPGLVVKLNGSPSRYNFSGLFGEFRAGDVQRRKRLNEETILGFPYAKAAVTQVVTDVSKMTLRLMMQRERHKSPAPYRRPVEIAIIDLLRRPNQYQTLKKFLESWLYSVLIFGNAYILIERRAGVVAALHVLHPWRAAPYVSTNGVVEYRLSSDDLAGIGGDVLVPARDVIHHVVNAMFHPLVGISPLHPVSLAAYQGLAIQESQATFFENGAQPGGILTAETALDADKAEELRERWDNEFTGENAGRVAVLGHNLKYQPIATTAKEALLTDQLKVTGEMICAALNLPPYIVHAAPLPAGMTPAQIKDLYYSNCLQSYIEDIEGLLDAALAPSPEYCFEFRIADLVRMDPKSEMETLRTGVDGKFLSINDARAEIGHPPVDGGDQPFVQMQDLPIEWALQMHQQALAAGAAPPPASQADVDRAFAALTSKVNAWTL